MSETLTNLIIVRYGEIALKGDNRSFFINRLIKNIKNSCQDLGEFTLSKTRGRIFIHTENNPAPFIPRLQKTPGIVSFSPAIKSGLSLKEAKKPVLKLVKKELKQKQTPLSFRVKTNRANKKFPGTSPEISREMGAFILKNTDGLTVDLEEPELCLQLDIRKNNIFVFVKSFMGPGGLPVGSSGRGLLLLSGGIDSPAAGWLAFKRGLELEAIHFHSPPYTGERARTKVLDLCTVLAETGLEIKLHLVEFTEIQRAIKKHCDTGLLITIMRRLMYRISCHLAAKIQARVLITGESIGQVSSQTLENISVINSTADRPVLRPLIGLNKQEIISIARDINTYDISTRPHQDCCTLFVPDHPATRPTEEQVSREEKQLDISGLLNNINEKIETILIKPDKKTTLEQK